MSCGCIRTRPTACNCLAASTTTTWRTNHIGDFQYASGGPAFAAHINNYYGGGRGDGFQLGNTTLPTDGANATDGPRSPFTVFFNDFTRTEEEVALFGEVAFDLTDSFSASLSARYYNLTSQLQGASNFSFGCRYGIGSNAQETADGRCNGTDFSNDVTVRLRTLGEYNKSGDDSVILNAWSPNGDDGSPRDLFPRRRLQPSHLGRHQERPRRYQRPEVRRLHQRERHHPQGHP